MVEKKWKLRYNVQQMTISGESGDVSGDTITSWEEKSSQATRKKIFGIWMK